MSAFETTWIGGIAFRVKTGILSSLRLLGDLSAKGPRKLERVESPVGHDWGSMNLVSESRSALYYDGPDAEKVLQAGKVHNLRIAAGRLNGTVLAPGKLFSFWRQIGRPGKLRGFVKGRELREGCLIPTVAGGLCQLSNAIYDCVLSAGLEVVERHAHTAAVPDSVVAPGRDATVFWAHVDLRFRSAQDMILRATLTDSALVVALYSTVPAKVSRFAKLAPLPDAGHAEIQSCASCGRTDCVHNVQGSIDTGAFGRTAVLVDEMWPEFDEYLKTIDRSRATIMLPLDGKRFKRTNYAWSSTGFLKRVTFPFFTLRRSIESRKLSAQGASRQRALLAQDKKLAGLMARRLGPEIGTLLVSQSLLPHLHELGALGGRCVDVFLSRMPIDTLQATLDAAAAKVGSGNTLSDFRADPALVRAESAAFEQVARVITPHRELAKRFGDLAAVVEWAAPTRPMNPVLRNAGQPLKVAFLGPTLGRKGAYEFRSALKMLISSGEAGAEAPGEKTVADGVAETEWIVLGALIEDKEFWGGLPVTHRAAINAQTLADIDVIVAPSYIEHVPRKLIAALASGRRVIATTACGLAPQPGLHLIDAGDVDALRKELRAVVIDSRS